MGDSIRDYSRSRSPRAERKRPYENSGSDERRVRRRSDEHSHGVAMRRTRSRSRSRSPRRSEYTNHRDSKRDRRHGDGDTYDSHNGAGHREDVRSSRYSRRSPRGREASRSRSPARHRSSRHDHDGTVPSHRHRHHHHSRHDSTPSHRGPPPELPCSARLLSRSADFDPFRPLFARYLDVQKQIDIAALDEREVRGRWKSFVNKWNNGELAEGWYRPETFEDAMLDFRRAGNRPEGGRRDSMNGRRLSGSSGRRIRNIHTSEHETYGTDTRLQDTEEEEDNDDYGPTLPAQDGMGSATSTTKSLSQTKHGPGIPSLSDLTLRRELEAVDRDDARALLRHERKADRALQKERLDELVPRADPGSQARRLEKRREVRDANAAFANAKSGGGDAMPELADSELMGGDGGGVEEYKRMKKEAERRRTEREVRREEIMRAKREEREERQREYREREEKTVDMLREIAKSRFG
ncbi:hypothetical protein F5Y10DRAFT_230332 [Nemania abortiva]|nr:hypothetical protein F5Y10DRAFT_230332 [Nemania abortiva]